MFFVHGGVATEDRERVREITESENNAIIVASYGTFSTGINIKNLHNIIFASPSKSRIRNLQSIGRVLRKGSNKSKAWKDIWGCGQGINAIKEVQSTSDLVNRLKVEYKGAKERVLAA